MGPALFAGAALACLALSVVLRRARSRAWVIVGPPFGVGSLTVTQPVPVGNERPFRWSVCTFGTVGHGLD